LFSGILPYHILAYFVLGEPRMGEIRKRRPKRIVERRPGGSYSLDDWLALRGISHSLVYQLWAQGAGPRRTRIGGRIFITDESDREFIEQNTEPAERNTEQAAVVAA
jgi:hypothetical protein